MHAVIDHQFETVEQQREAMRLGMWVFLASELMLFGGMFMLYIIYLPANRSSFAQASSRLFQSIGFVNTAVLLVSSLTMALAVHAAVADRGRAALRLLLATAALGALFLALKGVEYGLDFRESVIPSIRFDAAQFDDPDGARLFFVLYFAMTGLHMLHLIIAVAIVLVAAISLSRGAVKLGDTTLLRPVGLYWHLVDVIWVVLMPTLYLVPS